LFAFKRPTDFGFKSKNDFDYKQARENLIFNISGKRYLLPANF